MNRGAIYTAHGEVWAQRCADSVKSLRAHMPVLPITVFTNLHYHFIASDVAILPIPEGIAPRALKPTYALAHSPYESTLYIDADTRVCGDLTPAFDALDTYDLLIALQQPLGADADHDIPEIFPSFNGGILFYRRTRAVATLLKLWGDEYRSSLERDRGYDEPSLRRAIASTPGLSWLPLPKAYNFRTDEPYVVDCVPRILHGKSRLEELEAEMVR